MSNAGLLGLAQNVNQRESANRELAMLGNLERKIQQERDNEVLAQKEIEANKARFLEASKNLLEKDRVAVNKQFLNKQNALMEKLQYYGGDRTKFFEAGGLGELEGITNSILGSEEMARYDSNQKNLAKIMEAQEKGMGHLLSPNDLRSVENYNASKDGGQITYSGIMAEVEIPPSQNFDYGTEIPLANIMSFKSNAMKIRNNYKIANPDAPEPTPAQLASFAKQMGYGGTGSNQLRMRQLAEEKARIAKAKQKKKTDTKGAGGKKGKEVKRNFITEYKGLQTRMPKGTTVKQLTDGTFKKGMVEDMLSNNPDMRSIINPNNRNTLNSVRRNLDEQGPDFETIFTFGNKRMGLSNSYQILPHNNTDIAKRMFSTHTIENGMIKGFEPDETMYDMAGIPLTEGHQLEWDEYKGDYKIKGVFTGLTANTADKSTPSLIMDAYDNDGKVHDEATKELQEGFGNSEVGQATLIALEDEDGNLWYKPIDLSNPQVAQVFDVALNDDDDLTNQYAQEQDVARRINKAHQMTEDQTRMFVNSFEYYDDKLFQDDVFYDEGSNYWGKGGGSSLNRYPLMKSFYMASDYINNTKNGEGLTKASTTRNLIDKSLFSNTAALAGIEDMLRDYDGNHSEEQIIMKWLEGMNVGEEDGSYNKNQNEQLAAKWLQLVELRKKHM